MAIEFGKGGDEALGKIKTLDGLEYQLTWKDLKWAIIMVEGEAGGAGTTHSAAVLWTQAQTLMALRSNGVRLSFTDFIRGHSDPINPNKTSPEDYPPEDVEKRLRFQSSEWSDYNHNKQQFILDWAQGKIANPVPLATDFAVPGSGFIRPNFFQSGKVEFIWNSRGNTPEDIGTGQNARSVRFRDRGNTFISHTPTGGIANRKAPYRPPLGARGERNYSSNRSNWVKWPNDYVFIEHQQQRSQASSPEGLAQNLGEASPTNSQIARISMAPDKPAIERDRIGSLTGKRVAPPDDVTYPYFTVSEGDPQAEFVFENPDLLQGPFDRFYNQMLDLRTVSNLELNGVLPVLEILTTDEDGNIVNLNDKIFTQTQPEAFDALFGEIPVVNPERPIASLEGFDVNVQSPSVGGPTGIVVGKLNLTIHNPSAVRTEHPLGKYIAWMFRPGWVIRIRYGLRSTLNNTPASPIKFREEDFYISYHEFQVDNEQQAKLTLTVLPVHKKLLNQVLVGESLDIKSIGQITQSDIKQALEPLRTEEELTRQQVVEIENRLTSFQKMFNNTLRIIGTDSVQNENDTLGSILHGTVSNFELLRRPSGYEGIIVRNFAESLQSIQSILLSRRVENLIRANGYKVKLKSGASILGVNIGPLVDILVRPEIEKIARHAAHTGLSVEPLSDDFSLSGRTKVKIIYGSFNENAGDRAGKPISAFPIDIDELFSYVRQQRKLGKFLSDVNSFMRNISANVSTATYFNEIAETVGEDDSESEVTHDEVSQNIEKPEIKYSLYPDPSDESGWIFYVYDSKQTTINFSKHLHDLRDHSEEELTKEDIKQKCRELKIPWIEFGTDGSLVRNMTANTIADDALQSALMYAANNGVNQRRVDASDIAPGLAQNWIQSTGLDGQNIIRDYEIVMPLQVTVDHLMISNIPLFAHLYIFSPIPHLSGLYTVYELNHKINRDGAFSNLNMQINITHRNRINRDP